MFLIGSPGREVSNLRKEAAKAPQRVLIARTLPSQEIAYYPMSKSTSYSRLLTCSLSIQAGGVNEGRGKVVRGQVHARCGSGSQASWVEEN
jgi:hypothetical protein